MHRVKEFKDYSGNIGEKCDVCVIGSGAGGAVMAKELAEKGLSVVLLEEGGYFTDAQWTGKPLDSLPRMWRDAGMTGTMGVPPISITLGKCIGGTTAINSATCFRTPESILEQWQRRFGLDNLTLKTLEPHFKKVEKEIHVTRLSWDVLGKCARIIKRGCDRLGLTCQPLMHNVRDCVGAGTCQFGCPGGRKQSTDVSYIPRALELGVRIYAHCRADRLIMSHGKAVGVRGSLVDPVRNEKKAYSMTVRCRVVVVACGSLLTPQFLWKNRIRNRHIGRHLQIHPAGRVVALMNEKVEGWKGVSQGAYVSDFKDQGIALEGIFVHPSLLLAAMPGVGWDHKDLAIQLPRMAAFGVMIHDTTEGRVYRWRPFGMILARYILQRVDMDKFKKAIIHTARIFFAAGAARVYTGISKMPVLDSEADLKRLEEMPVRPGHMEILAFHPLGTCRMAARPEDGVVDRFGQSFQVKNLYLADGSIVPTSLGVNPQVTIMALSTYIADAIAGRLRQQLA